MRFYLSILAMLCITFSASSAEITAAEVYAATGVQGGLVVQLGCGDGTLTAALAEQDGYVVQGLEPDAAKAQAARARLLASGAYGKVSVMHWPEAHLPYVDNLVNLVLAENAGAVPMAEIMRVLVPDGVAYVHDGNAWRMEKKPRPGDIDEWTHYLYDASGNAVSHDEEVGQPSYVQWMAEPRATRSHEHLASFSAAVSAGGRFYYIADEGPIASIELPAAWYLVARDASNGILLWQRPLGTWEGDHRGFRSGPVEMPRRIVAIGDRVYVTLGYGEPVTALDGATGKTLHTYAGTEDALELVYANGVLYVVAGAFDPVELATAVERRGAVPPPKERRIVAVRAKDGAEVWRQEGALASRALTSTLCAGEGRVIYQTPDTLVCLDEGSGEELWRTPRPLISHRLEWDSPTLVITNGMVLAGERSGDPNPDPSAEITWEVNSGGNPGQKGEIIAYSLKDGSQLWSSPCQETYHAQVDVLVVNNELWTGFMTKRTEPGITEIRDIFTGNVTRTKEPDPETFDPGMGHHRCYRNKATTNYVILGRSGAEFLDTKTAEIRENHWIRGTCAYGVMPANGLLYVPPHSCACYSQAKLNGLNAFAARRQGAAGTSPLLVKGPAYESSDSSADPTPADWPTYRHDPMRSGATPMSLPSRLAKAWDAHLQPPLTGITAASGRAYVASIDTHTVYALDMASGSELWHFTAGGRVDSPPTVAGDSVLFGSADGFVYKLRASDGALAWRFRAAREDRWLAAYEQVESAWPVSGSVLVHDGAACFAAGRSSFVDDGIWVYRVDLETGEKLTENRVYSYEKASGQGPDIDGTRWIDGALPDILSCDGERLYMRHRVFDLEGTPLDEIRNHLYSVTGFLDQTNWHRTYWVYGSEVYGGWGGWWQMGNKVPSGRLLTIEDGKVYGFGRDFYPSGNAGQWNTGEQYVLFNSETEPGPIGDEDTAKDARRNAAPTKRTYDFDWYNEPDVEVRALVKAGKNLYSAGKLGNTTHSIVAYKGGEGSVLRVFSTEDGSVVSDMKLDAPPVFDGMAAADGKLLVSLEDGRVVCLDE